MAEPAETAAAAAEGAKPVDGLRLACDDPGCHFKPSRFQRRPVGPEDVLFELTHCGVCHSDLHSAANHMEGVGKSTTYPFTPGHELAGIVTQVGESVTKFKVGDHIGVGCIIDSCLNCAECERGAGHQCKQSTGTYGSQDKGTGRAETYPAGGKTIGGYSTHMVVHEKFGIYVPQSYPLECVGPVMCSGITMYEPLKKFGAKEGTRVGVVGLGGLGIMGIKLARALGCTVTAISRSPKKEEFAKSAGAQAFLASDDNKVMEGAAKSLDLILNTIPSDHDWTVYQRLVAENGSQVMLGANKALAAAYLLRKKNICHSFIGGIENTQEVIDLCVKDNILPEVVVVPVQEISEVYEKLDRANDSGKRYVLDIKGTLTESTLDSWETAAPQLGPNTTGFSKMGIAMTALRMAFW